MTLAQFQLTSKKKQLSISYLEAIINCINPGVAPTTYALLQKAQPTSAAVERPYSMLSKLLKKKGLLMLEMQKLHVPVLQ